MVRPKEKPRVYMSGNHAEANRRTGEFRMTPVDIADAHCLPEPPTLDQEGFALVRSRTGVADFFEKDAIEHVYYPEVVALLQESTGAVEVHIFDHTMRVQDDAKRKAHGTRLPVIAVHNDYTETSGTLRVRDLLSPEKAKRFLSGRFSMVNVWRSVGTSAERFPMAIADGRTFRRPTTSASISSIRIEWAKSTRTCIRRGSNGTTSQTCGVTKPCS
jgi:hypothetical protein